MDMVAETLVVNNPSGIHARPATELVAEAKKYHSSFTILKGKEKINGKSILSILTGELTRGSEIQIQFDGPDEQEALAAVSALIRSGLGEC